MNKDFRMAKKTKEDSNIIKIDISDEGRVITDRIKVSTLKQGNIIKTIDNDKLFMVFGKPFKNEEGVWAVNCSPIGNYEIYVPPVVEEEFPTLNVYEQE